MKTPRIKISHEVPLAVLSVSKTFNDYDYCLPHLLDKEYTAQNRVKRLRGTR